MNTLTELGYTYVRYDETTGTHHLRAPAGQLEVWISNKHATGKVVAYRNTVLQYAYDVEQIVGHPKTKWKREKEFADNTGRDLFYCECPQPDKSGSWPEHLFRLYFFPAEQRLWFFDQKEDSQTIRMKCDNWSQAELVKDRLTMMKSHYMELAAVTVTQRQALLAVCGVSKREKSRLRRERARALEGLSLADKLEAARKWNEASYVPAD
jgi:hypothetical protein